MKISKVVAVSTSAALALGAGAVAASPAAAGGRPTGVAFVHAVKTAHLHHDGSVTVRAWVRCKPGWDSSDLSMQLDQGGAYVSGYLNVQLPCDNAFRRVHLRLGPGYGKIKAGDATISSQFLVFNSESGDPSAGHQVGHPATVVTS
jgi:hypothetical protein